MPPKKTDSENAEKGSEKNPIDIDSILLPNTNTKPPPTGRVSAGVLVDQEQNATLHPAPTPEQLWVGKPPEKPAQPAVQPKNPAAIEPLETYQSDIQKVVGEQRTSVVSIAAAEANRSARRAPKPAEPQPENEEVTGIRSWVQFGKRALFINAGIFLIVVAAGAIIFVLVRPTAIPIKPPAQVAFISVDDSKNIILQPTDAHADLMTDLQSAKSAESLTTGLIAAFIPIEASSTAGTALLTGPQLLSLLAPNAPDLLVRNVGPSFLLGVHSFNGANQPFLMLTVDSYEDGYAGMLAWEETMPQDLAPFFLAPLPEPSAVAQAITQPTSTSVSSTTSTSTVVVQPTQTQFVPGVFSDSIIDNHDARVLLDQNGNILLLWTFIDRQTIVITTNQYTLGEIISRLKNTTITAIPGQ